jgi:short-subunit dehydrogenase
MTPSRFRGQVVWITGASSGIGEALAKTFAKAGSRLILSARRERELHRVAALCSGAPSISVLPLDLSKPGAMAEAVHRALDAAGAVDVMVHNAALGQRAFAADTAYDADDLIMRTNYLGPVALTKALLPSMRARRHGYFIVVSSILGKVGLPGRSAYCASKYALHGFFDTLRAEIAKDHIKITLVLPGTVRTNIAANAITATGTAQQPIDSGNGVGLTPEFCAGRILSAAEAGKAEVNIMQLREYAALYLNRFAPGLFRRVIRGRNV